MIIIRIINAEAPARPDVAGAVPPDLQTNG